MIEKRNEIYTKQKALQLINEIQDDYVNQLKNKILSKDPNEIIFKYINLTSPTGTGKTKMMIKLINQMPNHFFIVTSLSRGQLNRQIEDALKKECIHKNFVIHGTMSLTKNSILTEEDILNELPSNKDVIWLRDEAHINTNKWSPVLENRCFKIINFSATNRDSGGIKCNFVSTMMLRTVVQSIGNIDDALNRLIDVKNSHQIVTEYNPCAIFRVVSEEAEKQIIKLCKKYNLSFISLVDNDNFSMAKLCEDNDCHDVIINKQKIVEGIDIRRAHVIWFENTPKNEATVIQAIGRCRRNALLWRDDIDILDAEHKDLLEQTRQCFVYYNHSEAQIKTDEDGEFIMALCPYVSVEQLKPGHTIYVENGRMLNGLTVVELIGESGYYNIDVDEETGFNVVDCPSIYSEKISFVETPKFNECDHIWELLKNKSVEYWHNLQKDYVKFFNQSMYCSTIFQVDGQKLIKRSMPPIPTIDCNGMFEFQETVFDLNEIESYNERDEIEEVLFVCDKQKYCYQIKKVKTIHIIIDNNIEQITSAILQSLIQRACSSNALMKTQDRLLSIIGPGEFKTAKNNKRTYYVPDLSVTSKLSQDSKLNRYIEKTFSKQLEECQSQYFQKENKFNFEKRCNSCLGYCVEYYAKYDAFGEEYLEPYLSRAKKEYIKQNPLCALDGDVFETNERAKDITVVRACLLKHKEQVQQNIGTTNGTVVMSVEKLIETKMQSFIDAVKQLGLKTSDFIKKNCDIDAAKCCSPRLFTNHIVGFADVIEPNTIIDIKTTNCINKLMVKQVLAYYLLSTYRSDMHVKTVIVYDSVSGDYIKVNVENLLPRKIQQTPPQISPTNTHLIIQDKTKARISHTEVGCCVGVNSAFAKKYISILKNEFNKIKFHKRLMETDHYRLLCYLGGLDLNMCDEDVWFIFVNHLEWYFDRIINRNVEVSCYCTSSLTNMNMQTDLYSLLLQDQDVLIQTCEDSNTDMCFGATINKNSRRSKLCRSMYAIPDKRNSAWSKYVSIDFPTHYPEQYQKQPDKYEDKSCKTYTETWCQSHQQECLINFDKNIYLCNQIPEIKFQKAVSSLVEDAKLQEIEDLNDCKRSGVYVMVFDKHKQMYIDYSYNIKESIIQHWTSDVHFDKLPTGDRPLLVDSFGPLDCTRIFILPINKDKYEATNDLIMAINNVFLLNDVCDANLKNHRFDTDVEQLTEYYGLPKKYKKKKEKISTDVEFVCFSKTDQVDVEDLHAGDIVFLQKKDDTCYGRIISISGQYLNVNVLTNRYDAIPKYEKEKIDKIINESKNQRFAKKSTTIYKAKMELVTEQRKRWHYYEIEIDFIDWLNSN